MNRIVSSEAEELILVDRTDREIGYGSKAACHDGHGILHRAFSVFLFNDRGEILLQRRSASKRLWPGFWSNSCCSHPRRGETLAMATRRRLREELDLAARLEFVYKFDYQVSFGEAGSENELCHVFLGTTNDDVRANENEIASIRFVTASELAREFDSMPEQFTPWFRMEWQTLCSEFPGRLARYCNVDP